ncbi:MAG: CNNM domain-containing protein, partial [Gammaproteobacteria bacterium]|nr:CNNM domain-containing protein [Gammaproteobacteria bacterium]
MESFAVPSSILLLGLLLLTFFSAYFASSETAMMKLNPYKLRHLKDQGHGGAKRADKLLQRQDQLLGVILICNNLVNNCAALIAGVVCVRYFGDVGYGIAAVGLTIFFLIFAEIAPKTVAAERPEMIAYPSSWLLKPLLDVLRPLVLLVNWCSIGFVRPLLKSSDLSSQSLSIEELRTVLDSDVDNTVPNKDMLLALTYLQTNTVEDIMIPRDEIIGIDLTNPPDEIRTQILASRHTRHPIYR